MNSPKKKKAPVGAHRAAERAAQQNRTNDTSHYHIAAFMYCRYNRKSWDWLWACAAHTVENIELFDLTCSADR